MGDRLPRHLSRPEPLHEVPHQRHEVREEVRHHVRPDAVPLPPLCRQLHQPARVRDDAVRVKTDQRRSVELERRPRRAAAAAAVVDDLDLEVRDGEVPHGLPEGDERRPVARAGELGRGRVGQRGQHRDGGVDVEGEGHADRRAHRVRPHVRLPRPHGEGDEQATRAQRRAVAPAPHPAPLGRDELEPAAVDDEGHQHEAAEDHVVVERAQVRRRAVREGDQHQAEPHEMAVPQDPHDAQLRDGARDERARDHEP